MASVFRFVVGLAGGSRSSSWRTWAQNDSFYIAPREMGGGFKVSLHPPSERFPDGRFVFGATEEYLDAGGPMEPAGHPRWEAFEPSPMQPGFTRTCTVRVPYESVNWAKPLDGASKHHWVAPPAPGRAREVIFFLLAAGLEDADAVNHESYLGQVSNSRGERLIAMNREVTLSEHFHLSGHFDAEATAADYASVRAVAMGTLQEDGSCVMTEVSAQP